MFETSIASQAQNEFANSGINPLDKVFLLLLLLLHNRILTILAIILPLLLADEPDDFYEFTPEDYYRILATKKQGTAYNDHIFICKGVCAKMCNDLMV